MNVVSMTEVRPAVGSERIHEILARQREAFLQAGPPTLEQRRADLRKLKRAIKDNAERIALEIAGDFGSRSRYETLLADVWPTLAAIRHATGHLRNWMRPKPVSVSLEFLPARARILPQPVGVVGIISPWNYPFQLAIMPLIAALAAGNRVMLKPSELTPRTAQFLAEVTRDAGLPTGVFNVVHGYGEPAGASLVAHPGVQLISFVGETSTGQEIMRNGAATLKRLMMELGGKGPVLVFADANVERALDATIFGVYSLNGERCTAGSRVLVDESIYDPFVDALAARVARIRVGDPLDRNTEVGPLVHSEHAARVRSYIRLGQEEGARLVVGGEHPAGLADGNYVQPTLFSDVTRTMRIAREEIFGPVLCAMRFRSEEEALAMANDVPYGLAAYVWTENLGRGHRVAEGLQSGMVWVNSQNVRNLHTPFGGAKGSGMGRDGGRHSFDVYCEIKNISIALGDHPIPRFGAD